MEATTPSLSKLPWRPASTTRTRREKVKGNMIVSESNREVNGKDNDGKLVDESMIVLRLRIKEMKMMEMNREPPSDWMDWEKKYYEHYDDDVCEAIGLLQSYLMSVRPSVALGTVAIVALSLLISSGIALVHAIEIARRIIFCFGFS